MASPLKLCINKLTQKLQVSASNGSSFVLPPFTQEDAPLIEVQIVEPDPASGANAFSLPDISNFSLFLSVATAAPTGSGTSVMIVTQYSWTKDLTEKTFSSVVSFNTAALTTHLGASESKTAYLEISFSEGAGYLTIFRGTITIYAKANKSGTLSLVATLTPMSREEAISIFAKKLGTSGETITFTSPDGTKQRILGVNDDGAGIDYII